jgi:hypothetical protein
VWITPEADPPRRVKMEALTKARISVNTYMDPADVAMLDTLCRRTERNRSQVLRILIREAKVRDPDLVVELTPDLVMAEGKP